MAQEDCRRIIYSNDYEDLIVDHPGGRQYLDQNFQPDCVQEINSRFFLLYKKRIGAVLNDTRFGYSMVPRCFGLMDQASLEASGITAVRQQPFLNLYGRGIMIGIIDTGIDYTHPAFRQGDGRTRIAEIWDQTKEEGNGVRLFDYGRVYTRSELNEALDSDDPYEIADTRDEIGHGTFLAGVAAGSMNREVDFSGVAPQATLAVVKLKQAKPYLREHYLIPEGVPCYQENDIMAGIRYLFGLARDMELPIVIALGVGTSMGDHTGHGRLEQYIGSTAGVGSTTFVTAAGNEGIKGHHFLGSRLLADEYEDVEFQVEEGENGFTMELWGGNTGVFSVGLISPTGEYTEKIPIRAGQLQKIPFALEPTQLSIYYGLVEVGSGDEVIFMRLARPTPGIWRIRVFNDRNIPDSYHIWMPISQFVRPDTRFLKPDPYVTLTDPANNSVPITMTAYDHRNDSLYIQASRGYTRTGQVKPDLAAPGVNVQGPLPGGRYGQYSGTSVAAAHTAGAVALLLEWGLSQNPGRIIGSEEMKRLLMRGAKRTDNLEYPNREWGYGVLNLEQTFENLRTTI